MSTIFSKLSLYAVIIAAVFIATALYHVPSVKAATEAELEIQIQQLQLFIAALEQQLAQLTTTGSSSGGGTVTPQNPVAGSCPALSRALRSGISGSDVAALQQYLKSAGDYTYPEITGYFGAQTEAAVKRFQCRKNIVCSGTADTTGYGSVGPSTRSAIAASCGANPNPGGGVTACAVGQTTLSLGESKMFYTTSTVQSGISCQGETRTCTAGGVVTGNPAYVHATCSVVAPNSCTVSSGTTTTTVAHGAQQKFYKQATVLAGQNCEAFALLRTCSFGSLSGDSAYVHSSCAVAALGSCTLDGVTIAHGQSRDFYSHSNLAYTQSCSTHKQTRTCNDGVLTGSSSYNKANCTVTPARSCVLDDITYPHGTTRTFYSELVVGESASCSSYKEDRTCTDGSWSGHDGYKYAVCAKVGERWCRDGGVYVQHGSSATFYSLQTAPFGNTCSQFAQTRTCNNSDLSGSSAYGYSSCSVASAASCTLDGKTVAHNTSAPFYSARTVSGGTTCAMVQQNRTCLNGTLSGSASFQYQSCTAN